MRRSPSARLFIALDRPDRETLLTTSSVRRLMGTLSDEIGVKVRPHGFRHAAITAALDQGHDLRSVQHFARHANSAAMTTGAWAIRAAE